MGIEQGILVPSSNFELSPNIDFPDPRLSKTFKAWDRFKLTHPRQVASLGTLPIRHVALLAAELSKTISEAVGLSRPGTGVGVALDFKKISDLCQFLNAEGDRVMFMRHGEQNPPGRIASIEDPVIRKIRMMQNPFNSDDSLTNRGFVDVFATAFGLLYLAQATQRNVQVVSSENRRAREVGEIVVNMIPGSTFSVAEGLDSISYKDENDKPPVSLEQLMADLPTGHMPWIPEIVDRLCRVPQRGGKQSDLIIQTIADLLSLGSSPKGRNLLIALTHSQQIAEVSRVTNASHDLSARYPELSMVTVDEGNMVQVFPKGILVETSLISIGG